jgi:hypothetical protein
MVPWDSPGEVGLSPSHAAKERVRMAAPTTAGAKGRIRIRFRHIQASWKDSGLIGRARSGEWVARKLRGGTDGAPGVVDLEVESPVPGR